MKIFDFIRRRRTISEEKFSDSQYQHELLAYAYSIYTDGTKNFDLIKRSLLRMKRVRLTELQAETIVRRLAWWVNKMEGQQLYKLLMAKSKVLIQHDRHEEAFQLVYETYFRNTDNMNIVDLIYEIGDTFKAHHEVLASLEEIINKVPGQQYNLRYRKGLYLKSVNRFDEAIIVFRKLNLEHDFAWNYYQIAIIENLKGNKPGCIAYLKKTFALDPSLKEDALGYPELANLKTDSDFLEVVQS